MKEDNFSLIFSSALSLYVGFITKDKFIAVSIIFLWVLLMILKQLRILNKQAD